MTFTEFMSILNGEYKETAGTIAKNQCVDLANAYIRYVLGLPIIEWTNAVDFPSKAGSDYEYIKNSPNGVPLEGDLVIWGGNQYGHIAIFIEGNANRFTSFDQNYPTGSPCHVQEHTYTNVIGWLHPKIQPIASDTTGCQTQLQEEIKKKNETYQWGKELETDLEGAKAEIISHQNNLRAIASTLMTVDEMPKILGAITQLLSKEDQLRTTQKTLDEKVAELTVKTQEASKTKEELEGYKIANLAQAKDLEELGIQVKDLGEELETLKEQSNIKFTKLFWNIYFGEVI